jgi:hypothetical protein
MVLTVDSDYVHFGTGQPRSAVCPQCRQMVRFEPLRSARDEEIIPDILINEEQFVGSRYCPDPRCNAHLFIVYSEDQLHLTYPAMTIDFDVSDIPDEITRSLQEAITCHANCCYTAGAMMVRKAMEQMCQANQATGNNLKLRIQDLKSKVVLSSALFDALDHLRLLGNDAAHVEAQSYNEVGEQEVRIAITITKEILKSLYQTKSLVDQLKALQKPVSPSPQ